MTEAERLQFIAPHQATFKNLRWLQLVMKLKEEH